jgi:hypothetical protein
MFAHCFAPAPGWESLAQGLAPGRTSTEASSILPRTLRSSEHALAGIQTSAAPSERAAGHIKTQGSASLHPGLRSLTPSACSKRLAPENHLVAERFLP